MKKKAFAYAGITVEYTLAHKTVKNINVRIRPTGEVFVSAPPRVTEEELTAFLESKGEWIIRHLAEVAQRKAAEPDGELYTGKIIYLLGQAFPLEVLEGPVARVALYENHVAIFSPDLSQKKLKDTYLSWLRVLANSAYQELLDELYPLVAPLGAQKPVLQVKNMKTRWGSCNKQDGRVWLSLQLIKAPRPCVEAVLLHELVHLIHNNHSPTFYSLLTELMPDWKARKDTLEESPKDGII